LLQICTGIRVVLVEKTLRGTEAHEHDDDDDDVDNNNNNVVLYLSYAVIQLVLHFK